jgi:hypothetical protein
MLSGPRERCPRQKVCYQLLSGPRERGPRQATDDSERYHGQRLLSDPQNLSAYLASKTGTEMIVPVMNAITGRPTVGRTSTGVHETAALTLVAPSDGAEEPRG